MKTLEEAALASKRVLVRIDADVPLTNTEPVEINDDYRLQKLLPTIFYLINHRAKIILCGHLGRPPAKTDPSLSLKPIFLHLSALINQPILFAADPFSALTAKTITELADSTMVGLENLRFFKGEEDNSRTFARKLALLADIYVDESFATAHREAASTVAITEFLPSFAGLQFEQEIEMLTQLTKHPARPFVVMIGGAKISDKLPVIRQLLPFVDRVLVGGAVANTFLASQGTDIKDSKIENEFIDQADEIFRQAKGKIILPIDYIWSREQILDIGPNSVARMLPYLKGAKTILWSGVVGQVEKPEFARSSTVIAQTLTNSAATSIIGGGDTVGFINGLKLTHHFSFVSTGGSAMLELLGGRILPGLRALD